MLSLLILIFAEILPKTLATLYADKIAYSAAPLLTVLFKITYPISYALFSLNEMLFKLFRLSSKSKQEFITKEEYKEMILQGATSQKEFHHSLMMGILELNDIDVHHIMTNRKHIDLINLQQPIDNIKKAIINAKHENLVVIDGNLEKIIGTIHTKSAWHLMLKEKFNLVSLKNTVDSPYFIPEKVSIPKQWHHFQTQEKKVAIVINEFGETQGVLTKNDIVQEIFVNSQSQDHKNLGLGIARIADKTWVISGQTSCHHLKKLYKWSIPTDDADTIGGSIINYLESLPNIGVCIKINSLIYEVLKVDKHKILKIKVTLKK
jgi:Mg2+/Co2+ transporter CorB